MGSLQPRGARGTAPDPPQPAASRARLRLAIAAVAATVATAACGAAPAGGPASPTGSPQVPTSVTDQWVVAVDPGTASTASPVVWFLDAHDDRLLVASTWSGRLAGTLRVTGPGPFSVLQSPDGTALVLRGTRPADGGRIAGSARGAVHWARDASHLCGFRTESGAVYVPTVRPATPPAPANAFVGEAAPGVLFLDDPAAGSSRMVERSGRFGDHGGPVVLACSVPDDRAVTASAFTATMSSVHAVRLSDGSSVGAPGFGAPTGDDGPAGAVASPDGRLVALGSTAGGHAAHDRFVIRDVDTGATLASVDGAIATFSDDGTRVLTETVIGTTSESVRYQLVDWRDGRVLWSLDSTPGPVLVRPGSADILVQPWEYRAVPGTAGQRQPVTRPLVVHADGSTTAFPAEVRPADG